jgi:hypothetical protein
VTTIPFGSTGTLLTRDDFAADGGGLTDVGAGSPPWAVDDGDAGYLLWTSHNFLPAGEPLPGIVPPTPEGEIDRAIVELTWSPGRLAADSITFRTVAKASVGYVGEPFLQLLIWKSDLTDVGSFSGLGNFAGSGDYETIEGTLAASSPAMGWLAAVDAFIQMRFMRQDAGGGGAVGLFAGDQIRYTLLELDITPAIRPPLRQFPRDDGLSGTSAPRQRLAMPSSLQFSPRQLPAGYL